MTDLIRKNVKLASFTSWQIGGEADFFCEPNSIDSLIECYQWAFQNNHPVTILGGGSNVLVSDQGVEGLVICTRKLSCVTYHEDQDLGRLVIRASAGVRKSELLKLFLKFQLAPALFLAGLPGDVGGGVIMNAGVSEDFTPKEFGQIVDWVEVLRPDMTIVRVAHNEVNWSYRKAQGWQPGVLTQAQMSWPLEPNSEILNQVKSANRNRLSKQPLDLPSCGSVFKNPLPHKAAQLIDKAGLKGYSIGGAQVSPKHANFIVNLGTASASDTWSLMMEVKDTVENKFGVSLETEVVRMGRW